MDLLDFFCIIFDNLNFFSCIKINYCLNCYRRILKEIKCL